MEPLHLLLVLIEDYAARGLQTKDAREECRELTRDRLCRCPPRPAREGGLRRTERRLRKGRPVQTHHRQGRVGDAVVLGGGVSMEARLRHPWLRGGRGILLEGTNWVVLWRTGDEAVEGSELIIILHSSCE